MVAVVVVMCYLGSLGTESGADCNEIVITRDVTPMQCTLGEPAIAQWKNEHTLYADYRYAVKEWRCEPADYQPKRGA